MSEARQLPVLDPQSYGAVCAVVDGCLTCGDVAVPVTVVEQGDPDAICADDHGTRGSVGVELVAPVHTGERLLVHGGVAISRLEDERPHYGAEEAIAGQLYVHEEAIAPAIARPHYGAEEAIAGQLYVHEEAIASAIADHLKQTKLEAEGQHYGAEEAIASAIADHLKQTK